MDNNAELNNRFGIPGLISVEQGNGGLTKVVITSGPDSRAVAEIYLNGATVTRCDIDGRALLFCSRTSKFEPGKAIRGGVPIIFPWFGPHPTDPKLQQHGLVRSAEWTIASTQRAADGGAAVTLGFESSEATRAIWPYDFSLRYTVSVGRTLEMALEVTNRSSSEFRFEEALHTYLPVSDVRAATITGLENTEYVDKVDGMKRKRLSSDPLVLSGETDRVFLNTPAACVLHDPVNGNIIVGKDGSRSTVIWNPWETKAEGLADLAGGQWPGFVCIESVNGMENSVTLAPGASHTMTATVAPAN
jgi:glucose-6-phosphate 1-epimerase